MRTLRRITLGLLAAAAVHTQSPLPAGLQLKVRAKAKELQSWSTDPAIVTAVRAHNASPPAEAQGMTNEKWKTLSVLDPFVRALTKNAASQWIKSKQDPVISEAYVSGADGTKVAFLSKTTWWSHKGMDKHMVPMTGKTWFGPVEVDESTGVQAVQIGLPVLDGGKPIGSIVVGLNVARLR